MLQDSVTSSEDIHTSEFTFWLKFVVKYPDLNLRFYRRRGGEMSGEQGLGIREEWLLGGVLEAPTYPPALLERMRNPATPRLELARRTWEFSSAGERARRNPSLPENILRECMVAGSWDAWLNPAARMVLMTSPGEDLLMGAMEAALDCFPAEKIRGLDKGLTGALAWLLHCARIQSVSRYPQRQVLLALKDLLAPILEGA